MASHEGRVYLIVAATSGIGSALARRLTTAGAKVALAARNTAALDALGAQLGAGEFGRGPHRLAESRSDCRGKGCGRGNGSVCGGDLCEKWHPRQLRRPRTHADATHREPHAKRSTA